MPEDSEVNTRELLLLTHQSGKVHLPLPKGQYSVGYMDIMTPNDHKTSTFFRLYYPTDEDSSMKHQHWPLWMIGSKNYISGLLSSMKAMVIKWPSWVPRKEFYLYSLAQYIVKYLPNYIVTKIYEYFIGKVYIPIIKDAALKVGDNGKKWPIIVFSHGLGCCRIMYSQLCYDLTSQGFVVAAIEHRDGSACMSLSLGDAAEKGVKWINHYQLKKEDDEYARRNDQVQLRSKEASNALDVLCDWQKGKFVDNVFENTYNPCRESVSVGNSTISKEQKMLQFQGTLDVDQVIMLGHSFGGATSVLALEQDPRFKIGIVLDGWLFPIKDMNLAETMKKPIMFVTTESFLNSENLKAMELSPNQEKRKFFVIKGSVHQNFVDASSIMKEGMFKRFLGLHSQRSPKMVMKLNDELIMCFIQEHFAVDNQDAANNKKSVRLQFQMKEFDCHGTKKIFMTG